MAGRGVWKVHWRILKPSAMKSNLPHLELQPDGLSSRQRRYFQATPTTLPSALPSRVCAPCGSRPPRIRACPTADPASRITKAPIGGFFLSELHILKNGVRLKVASATETNGEQPDLVSDSAAEKVTAKKAAKKKNTAMATQDGNMSSGWQVLGGEGQHQAAVFILEKPIDLGPDFALKMQFERALRLLPWPLPHLGYHG